MIDNMTAKAPRWLTILAVAGIAWNVFGLWQFAGSFAQTETTLVQAGMTPAQAAIYLSLPVWVSMSFGVGVLGGLVGAIALLMRHVISLPVLAASLVGYIVLFVADWSFGVFANIPEQLAILAVVLLIAVILLAAADVARRQSLLRA